MTQYDIVIIGGGVIGSAIAYFTLSDPDFRGRLAVIEKDPTYAEAATPRSAGGVRQQFSTPENIRLSIFGEAFIKSADRHLAVDEEKLQLSFVENGYLFLASAAGMPILQENHAAQIAEGAAIALLDASQLKARFPWLVVEDLAGGCLGLAHEGWTDPYSLLQAFRRKAIALGAHYIADRAIGLERRGRRIESVQLAQAGRIGCGQLVNAAGYVAHEVANWAGFDLPVRPRKRFVFPFDCRDPAAAKAPLTIDPSGVYFRPEGAGYICGVSPPETEDPDCLDFEIDFRLFEETIWPALAQRVPIFESIKPGRAWAGHYDYNTVDQNAILGLGPDLDNFFCANGFSGHGLQQSPGVGRATAELLVHGRYLSLDLSRFGFERFAAGAPILERNVV